MTSGAIGTTKVMMLSGNGPTEHPKEHRIEVVADVPGVGENLNVHFGIDIVAELKGHDSLIKYNKWSNAVLADLQYYALKLGPVISNVVEGGAFWHSGLRAGRVPDLQFRFLAGVGAEGGGERAAGIIGTTLNSYPCA